jgi:hypothetical protein
MHHSKLFFFLLYVFPFLITSCKQKEKRESKYENGQVKEQYEVVKGDNGSYLKDGTYVLFYENGQKKEEALYEDNQLSGPYKKWHQNGKIQAEGAYKSDSLEGLYKMYNKNGELESSYQFTNGKVNGEVQVYDKGKPVVKGNFQNGKANGTWVLYNENSEQIGKVEMANGAYKGPVQSSSKIAEQSGGASFLGFTLNKTTYPEVKLGFLDKGYVPATASERNGFTGGRMVAFSGSEVGMEDIKEGSFIFDKDDKFVALRFTLPKGKSSKYGGGRMANFHALRDALAKEYKLVSENIPFVGNSSAKFYRGNCYVLIDSPHLDFDMSVYYWLDGFAEAITSVEGND